MRRRLLVAAERGSGPLLVRDDAWAPGLVGLVAGRLADSLARPVAAATLVGDEVRGSVRAPTDFHVAAALEACAALLTKRGGHAAAGGFSLLPESWADFSAAFAALPRPFPADVAAEAERPGRVVVDLVLPGSPPRLDARRRARAPRAVSGRGTSSRSWRSPAWCSTEARRVGADGAACRPADAAGPRDVRRDRLRARCRSGRCPEPGDEVDLVGTLERDDFGGMPRLRLRVRRLRAPIVEPADGATPPAGPGSGGMSGTALERLRARRAAVGSPLCLGIDPHPDALPDGLQPTVEGIETFARGLIEAAAPHACAVKINVAFFEAFGSAGWAALERTRADVPARRPLHPRREARRHRSTCGTVCGRAPRPPRRRRRHRLAVPGRGCRRAVPRDGGPARLPPGPHEQPIGRPLPVARRRRGADPPARRALGRRSAGPMAGSDSSSARRLPRSWRVSRGGARARPSWSPASARRAVTPERPRARRTGRGRPGLVNVSRAIALASRAAPTGRAAAAAAASVHSALLSEAVLHSMASPVRTAKIGGI